MAGTRVDCRSFRGAEKARWPARRVPRAHRAQAWKASPKERRGYLGTLKLPPIGWASIHGSRLNERLVAELSRRCETSSFASPPRGGFAMSSPLTFLASTLRGVVL